jgi:asparagine synthase (glutamine-hydrolysing)
MYAREAPPPHRACWPLLVNHLSHRGPDEGGWWADGPFFLGHRRLSILDISCGQQPMASADGRFVVTFNGEIYNYLELRTELESRGCRFRTNSDTEVLLHGYREWGRFLPARLTGMFAFAVADRLRKELYLARDRFGEKPLFISRIGRYIAFASELRPLAALPDMPQELDETALAEYLVLNYVPGTATLLRHVRRVAPASWKLFSPIGETGESYWSLPEQAAPEKDMQDAVHEWRERFDRAVTFCLRSDVPVGVFLSGGIDSALVAESAVRQGRLNRAYCIDFQEEGYSEYPAAKAVAQRLDLPIERVTLSADVLSDFVRIVEHADDPLADSSSVAVWALSRYTAYRGNKVVLGGDGGDELFAGYLTYRATQLHSRLVEPLPDPLRRSLHWLGTHLPTTEGKVTFSYRLWRFLRACHIPSAQAHFSWNGTWLPQDAARLLRNNAARAAACDALANIAARAGLDRDFDLTALQRCDLREYLVNDILVKSDRQSMAHGLEVRAPFLEHELAAWSLMRPDSAKLGKRGELKALLRAAARRIYGNEIGNRPKQGFSIPIHKWVRGPLSTVVRDLLSKSSIERLDVLDPSAVLRVVEDHFSGVRSYGFEIWGLAVLVQWHRIRIQRRPSDPRDLPLTERVFPMAG